jgi:hypothetical protein
MAMDIDLNCDMGESFGIFKIGNDEEPVSVSTGIILGGRKSPRPCERTWRAKG